MDIYIYIYIYIRIYHPVHAITIDISGSHCAWATRIPSNPVSHRYVPHRSHGTLLLHFPLVIVFHLYFLAFCSADFTECMILPRDFYWFHTWASGRLRFLVRALSRQGLRPSACPIRAERCCGTLVGGSVLPRKPSGTSIWSRNFHVFVMSSDITNEACFIRVFAKSTFHLPGNPSFYRGRDDI